MRTVEIRQYEVLLRVRDFLESHRHWFQNSKACEAAYATVVTAIDALSDHASATSSVTRQARRARKLARVALIKKLEAVLRIVRVIADDTPGFDEAFSRPKQETEQTLLTTARAFIRAIEPVTHAFADHGMATVTADLQALVFQFEQAIRAGDERRKWSLAAYDDIKAALASGGNAVRKLDAIAPNYLPEGSDERALWDRVRRLDYQRRRKTHGMTDETSPPLP